MRGLVMAFGAAAAAMVGPAPAQARYADAPGYASAMYGTARNCAAGVAVCSGSGQPVLDRFYAGGLGVAVDDAFTSTAASTPVSGSGQVSFGDVGLPQIRASASAGETARTGTTIYSFQTYSYEGADDLDLLLSGLFHIVDSSTDGQNGTYAGGATAFAGFAIWNAADFYAFLPTDAAELTPQAFFTLPALFGNGGCDAFGEGGGGPRGVGYAGSGLAGGPNQSFALAQQNCWEETLTLSQGDQFVIATFTQLTANRGGWVDATGTFTVGLDPAMGAEATAAFRQNVSFDAPAVDAVPEPASWAMLVLGFAATGAALRGRRAAPALG